MYPKSTGQYSIPTRRPRPASLRLLPLLAIFSVVAGSSFTFAQNTGIVAGRASNAATKAYLEGVEVTLDPGNLSAATASNGEFIITDVPPGTYSLTATYTGLDPQTVRISVGPNSRSEHDLQLSSAIYRLNKFVVAGEREGNAAAITAQRNADNIKNVISSDAFGSLADLNIGNVLKRLPGVASVEYEGEVVAVMIRGMDDKLSMVTLDGEQGANASDSAGMSRRFEVDKISADFIESIELVKTLTPDMEAGAISGMVNMKTKSALTRKGQLFTFEVGTGYTVDQKTFRPLGVMSYSNVYGADQRLGVLLSASYNKADTTRGVFFFNYESTPETNRPVWFTASAFGTDFVERDRKGLNVRLDYKLTRDTTLFASFMYSKYDDLLDRRRGIIANPTAANLIRVTETSTEARNQNITFQQNWISRHVNTRTLMVGSESKWLGGKLDFQGSVSPSVGWSSKVAIPRVVTGAQFLQERPVSHDYGTITQTGGPDIYDPRNSLVTSMTDVDSDINDRVLAAQVNLSKNLPMRWPLILKTGARYRSVRKSLDNTNGTYAFVGPNGVAGPVGVANDDNLAQYLDLGYNLPGFKNPTGPTAVFYPLKLMEVLAANPNYFTKNLAASVQGSVANDTRITEDIAAAYVMGTLKVGRLTAVGGVRFEDTKDVGRANKNEINKAEVARRAAYVGAVTPEETIRRTLAQYANPVEISSGYHDFFPSLNLHYHFGANLIARAGFAKSIGRPDYSSIVPTIAVNDIDEILTANNPNLKPQSARNYDLSLEYYFKSAGMISAGAFRKDLRGFLYRSTSPVPLAAGNPYGDAYIGYDLTSDFNGGKAWVRGLEFAYQQEFSNTPLPAFLRPFGVFANYTWLQTEGNFNDPTSVSGPGSLPGFTPRSGNVGLSYLARGWTFRVRAKYESVRLRNYKPNVWDRDYLNFSHPVDLNVAYSVNRNIRLFMDVVNVFHSRTYNDYRYTPNQPWRTFVFSSFIKAGVSGRF